MDVVQAQRDPVASMTLAAVHRRDHRHPLADGCCRPHAVEVVRLGPWAVTVCHDCGFEYGFDQARPCESAAEQHRRATA
jgi:hypothetical protein